MVLVEINCVGGYKSSLNNITYSDFYQIRIDDPVGL